MVTPYSDPFLARRAMPSADRPPAEPLAPLNRDQPNRDQPAWDWRSELRRCEAWLRVVVLARLGEPAAVGDVLQEVALAAGKGASKLRDPSRAEAWLYRLAVTAALQYRRRAGRRRKLVDRYRDRAAPSEAIDTLDPLDWLLAEEQRQLVRRALATLPPRDAEVLLLKYTQDWSYRQIAERLAVSEAAVEGRLHRARTKLRSALRAVDPAFTSSASLYSR